MSTMTVSAPVSVPTFGREVAAASFTPAPRNASWPTKVKFPRGWDWERHESDEDLTPAKMRRESSCKVVILAAFLDIAVALKGVITAREKKASETQFDEDVRGVLRYAEHEANLIEGNIIPPAWAYAEMKKHERQLAFVRGQDGCCGCHALRGLRSLEHAKGVVAAVAARLDKAGDGDTWLADDAEGWAWMLNLLHQHYEMSVEFQNPAALRAFGATIETKYPPRTFQTETETAALESAH